MIRQLLAIAVLAVSASAQVGIGYELGSRADTAFGLRTALMDAEGRGEFWSNLDQLASQGLEHVVLHRLYGEPTPGDFFDYDTRYQIRTSDDPALIAYERDMTLGLTKFATAHPKVQIDLYFGSLRQRRMQRLISQDPQAWLDRVMGELSVARELIRKGSNIRMVFDHSATYAGDSAEWMVLHHLSRMHPNRVIIEAVPPVGSPQAALPCWVFDDLYTSLLERDPDRLERDGITRMSRGASQSDPVGFVVDCDENGHRPVVSDTALRGTGLTIREIERQAGIGDPQGVD